MGRKMRISVSDSLRHGFKKWSGAQDAKPPPIAGGSVVGRTEQRCPIATAAGKEGGDDLG